MKSLFARATGIPDPVSRAVAPGACDDADPAAVAVEILRVADRYGRGAPHRTPALLQEMLALAPLADGAAVREAVLDLADSAARALNMLAQLRAVQHDWAAARRAEPDVPAARPASPQLHVTTSDPRGIAASAADLLLARRRMRAFGFDALPNAPVWPRAKLLLQAFGFDAALIGFLRGGPDVTPEEAVSLLAEAEAAHAPVFRTQLVQLFEFLVFTLGLIEPPESASLRFPDPEPPLPRLASTLDALG